MTRITPEQLARIWRHIDKTYKDGTFMGSEVGGAQATTMLRWQAAKVFYPMRLYISPSDYERHVGRYSVGVGYGLSETGEALLALYATRRYRVGFLNEERLGIMETGAAMQLLGCLIQWGSPATHHMAIMLLAQYQGDLPFLSKAAWAWATKELKKVEKEILK